MTLSICRIEDVTSELSLLREVSERVFSPEDLSDSVFFLALSPEVYWICVDDQKVGVLMIKPDATVGDVICDEPPTSSGSLFIVSVGFEKRGERERCLGVDIFDWLEESARSRGFHQIVSSFRRSNTALKTLHHDCGFHCAGERPDFYQFPVEDAVVAHHAL